MALLQGNYTESKNAQGATILTNSGTSAPTGTKAPLTADQMATRATHLVDPATGTAPIEKVSPAVSTPTSPATTNVPNPATTQVGTGLPGAPTANPATTSGNIPLTPEQQANYNAYQTGFAKTKASGVAAPATAGAAAATVQGSIPTPPADTSNIDNALANDKGYQQLLKDQQEYNNVTQHQSLVDTYTQMIKKAGIPSLDTQLLNTKKIIDGTEQDIRNEVQAVSGFATDSQVLALASARNKTLIQNYNNLLDTKQMAMDNVKTMIGLAQTDQQTAQQNIITKMGIDQKLVDYRDKFVNAAKEGFNTVISAVGISGLYNSLMNSDPTGGTLAKAAQTLGLDPNQMKTLATADAKQRAQDLQSKNLDLQSKGLDIQSKKLDIQQKEQALNPTGGSSLPYNSSYASPKDYVNAVLTKAGVDYNKAANSTPKGTVFAIDNKTGQTFYIDAKDWDANSGAIRPSYTVIYNNK